MRVKPVYHIPKPKYPAKKEIYLNWASLQYRPKKWYVAPAAGLLVGAMVFGLTGCKTYVAAGNMVVPSPPLPEAQQYVAAGNMVMPTHEAQQIEYHIPVSRHGYQGISYHTNGKLLGIYPEVDAMKIISEELEAEGLILQPEADPKDAVLNISDKQCDLEVPTSEEFEPAQADFLCDGIIQVSDRTIKVEYVSVDDYTKWFSDLEKPVDSSRTSVCPKLAAGVLADSNENTVVFYDPLAFAQSQDEEAAAKEYAEKMLREQIKDFINWLKGQGLI